MTPGTWIALVAFLFSLVALYRGERLQQTFQELQAKDASLQNNISALVGVWNSIAKKPSVLRFHGVTEKEMKEAGIDAEELAYLIASFDTASHYYEYIDKRGGQFPRTSIRYTMCASESTRKAWPVLKRFFASDSLYFEKIEETIAALAREGTT
ncbi:MAG TPA: hypothetical protein VGR07_16645 [Thermoanaerobaculia bacterium]|jgi:hypothetical protein|nr:hypothetical protein [Thermoanaerobaculia bacterium]